MAAPVTSCRGVVIATALRGGLWMRPSVIIRCKWGFDDLVEPPRAARAAEPETPTESVVYA